MCLGSGFGIGAAGNAAFYKGFPQTTSISSVVASLIVTTKSQLLFNAKLDVSTANNKWVLHGDLVIPPSPGGLVIFAHGSGSSRFSARNRSVAHILQQPQGK